MPVAKAFYEEKEFDTVGCSDVGRGNFKLLPEVGKKQEKRGKRKEGG